MRIGCSKLKQDLCYNLHAIDNTICSCGALVEDAHHYFFTCPNYNNLRLQLFNGIAVYCDVTLNTILYGNPQFQLNINKAIFDAVHLYIEKSNRFA